MIFVGVFASVMLLTTYPFFIWCDRRRVRAHLFTRQQAKNLGAPANLSDFGEADVAKCLDDIARRMRLGGSNVDAFCDAVDHCPPISQHWQRAARQARLNGNVPLALQEHNDWTNPVLARAATALSVAHVGGSFIPAALERAARSHRDRWAFGQDLRVATSQARLSAQVLTILPIAILVLSSFSGTGVSFFLDSPALILVLVVGIILNYVGWRWISRTTKAIT